MSAVALTFNRSHSPTIKEAFYWCERQVNRITSSLPAENKFKEIVIRVALIFSLVIPLIGLLSKMICYDSRDKIAAVTHPRPLMKIPPSIPPEKPILDGYGEYIIRYSNDPALVDFNTFTQATQVLNRFQAVRWMSEHPQATPQDRLEAMQREIRQIDPRLELTFIPKTLFELYFLRKTIEEDVEKANHFPYQDPQHPTSAEEEQVRAMAYTSKNSWLNIFQERRGFHTTLEISDNENDPAKIARLKEIAHRFNGAFQTLLTEKQFNQSLSMGQIEQLLEEQIAYIKEKPRQEFANSNEPGPSSHFATESGRGSLHSMKLAEEPMIDIFRKAIRLECAEEAKGKVLLYRGGKVDNDYPLIYKRSTGEQCYSISYGGSLFGGILKDPGATAYHFMRTRDRDAYALYFDPKNTSDNHLLHAPEPTSLKSLFETGEWFHGRSKAYLLDPQERVYGIQIGSVSYDVFPHKSPLTKDRLTALFQEKMNHGFLLKAAENA